MNKDLTSLERDVLSAISHGSFDQWIESYDPERKKRRIDAKKALALMGLIEKAANGEWRIADSAEGLQYDPPCQDLFRAVKRLPGIHIVDVSSGHGKEPVTLWFETDNDEHRGLFILARSADRRYWKYGDRWSITVDVSDVMDDGRLPITYLLESADVGSKAYRHAASLVDNIQNHLNHKEFMRDYELEQR